MIIFYINERAQTCEYIETGLSALVNVFMMLAIMFYTNTIGDDMFLSVFTTDHPAISDVAL